MTIYLELCSPTPSRRARPSGKLTAFQARRNGFLICTDTHVRKWVSEKLARKALARDFPGEEVVGVEERKTA